MTHPEMANAGADQRLAEIEAREQAATRGPWHCEGQGGLQMDGVRDHYRVTAGSHRGPAYISVAVSADRHQRAADAAFVAHARDDVPWLLAELRRARALVEAACREGWEVGRDWLIPLSQRQQGQADAAWAKSDSREALAPTETPEETPDV